MYADSLLPSPMEAIPLFFPLNQFFNLPSPKNKSYVVLP
jgi:hypothetical protein